MTRSFVRDMTHSHECHDWLTCVTWLIHMCNNNDAASQVWRDSFICMPWLTHTCDISRLDMLHQSCGFLGVMWQAYLYVWHGSFIRVSFRMDEPCHTYEWVCSQDPIPIPHMSMEWVMSCITCQTYEWVMSHIWMRHVTHMHQSCHTYEWNMSHVIWTSHVKYKCVMSHIWMSCIT